MSILYSRGSLLLASAATAANKHIMPKVVCRCAPIHTSVLAGKAGGKKARAAKKLPKANIIQYEIANELSEPDSEQPDADATPETDSKKPPTDPRHAEFCESFLAALKEASTVPLEPLPVDKTTQAIDQQLAGALKELFTKYPVVVSPKLLERRKQLRESYPELFKDISDKELDS
ncbi:hypothetical protein GGH91_002477 [Coemansia sp. RSA 2671]|nr:hypothetical protein IWW57_001271 [Coemansia sp. S610]KAJ2345607.1 hypothetical protein GGH91_002477 [Coemansia sp. RSA 2671]